MSKLILTALLMVATTGFAQQKPKFAGNYQGTLGMFSINLHLVAGPHGSLSGTMDSLSQRVYGLPCTDFEVENQHLRFSVPKVSGTWAGVLSADGSSLSGKWDQHLPSGPMTLNFTRVGTTADASSRLVSQGGSPVAGKAQFDDSEHTIAIPRPDGVTVIFTRKDIKVNGFHRVNFVLLHKKGSVARFALKTLQPRPGSDSVSGAGEEFLYESGGLIYDSGFGTSNILESPGALRAKQLSQIVIAAVDDVRRIEGHEDFKPDGYKEIKRVSQYRLHSDGSF
jgi:hypothetical protein